MRGKIREQRFHDVLLRITPAYAGKKNRSQGGKHREKDHPRLCGEKQVQWFGNYAIPGSPPPMRGKIINGRVLVVLDGITPAYAGKKHKKQPVLVSP